MNPPTDSQLRLDEMRKLFEEQNAWLDRRFAGYIRSGTGGEAAPTDPVDVLIASAPSTTTSVVAAPPAATSVTIATTPRLTNSTRVFLGNSDQHAWIHSPRVFSADPNDDERTFDGLLTSAPAPPLDAVASTDLTTPCLNFPLIPHEGPGHQSRHTLTPAPFAPPASPTAATRTLNATSTELAAPRHLNDGDELDLGDPPTVREYQLQELEKLQFVAANPAIAFRLLQAPASPDLVALPVKRSLHTPRLADPALRDLLRSPLAADVTLLDMCVDFAPSNAADYTTSCSMYCRSGFTSMPTTPLSSSTPTWVPDEVVNSFDK